jgi:hypothetical protein
MVGERGLLLVAYGDSEEEDEDEDAVPQSTIVRCELQSQYYQKHQGHHRRHCHKLQQHQQQHGGQRQHLSDEFSPLFKQMRSATTGDCSALPSTAHTESSTR